MNRLRVPPNLDENPNSKSHLSGFARELTPMTLAVRMPGSLRGVLITYRRKPGSVATIDVLIVRFRKISQLFGDYPRVVQPLDAICTVLFWLVAGLVLEAVDSPVDRKAK